MLRCRMHQWRMLRSLADDEPLPPPTERHLAVCPPCREFRRRHLDLRARLRAEAPPAEAMDDAMVARIVSAAMAGAAAAGTQDTAFRAVGGAARLRRTIPLRFAAGLAAAACAAMAIGLYVYWPAGKAGMAPGGKVGAGLAVSQPGKGVKPAAPPMPLSQPIWPDVRELAAAPIEQEMRRLAEDTRQIGSAMLAPLPRWLLPPSARPPLDDPPPRRQDSPRPAGEQPAPDRRMPAPPDGANRPLKPAGMTPAGLWPWILRVG